MATALPTTKSDTTFATDMGPSRPLDPAHRAQVVDEGRTIHVGDVEELAGGDLLSCYESGGVVIVERTHNGRRGTRALALRPSDPAWLTGAPIPEAAFSVMIAEFQGTPWSEQSYTSIWTVRGLRLKDTAEAFVED